MKRMNTIYILFLVFLMRVFLPALNDTYISLKHSIVVTDVALIIFYIAQIAAVITVAVTTGKLIQNVKRKIIFDRKNLRLLKLLARGIMVPVIILIVGQIARVYEDDMLTGGPYIWIMGALFVLFITEIFKKGIELKEEQDMVI